MDRWKARKLICCQIFGVLTYELNCDVMKILTQMWTVRDHSLMMSDDFWQLLTPLPPLLSYFYLINVWFFGWFQTPLSPLKLDNINEWSLGTLNLLITISLKCSFFHQLNYKQWKTLKASLGFLQKSNWIMNQWSKFPWHKEKKDC